jgi:hypothetical protein
VSFTGRCACGKITVAITADKPVGTRQCWCRQCQKIAAGGPTHNAIFLAEDVKVTGVLATSAWTAASGNTLTHSFCPLCGTQIYGQSSARMNLKTVRIGVLDTPHGLRPKMAIWTAEAPDWALIDPAIKHYEGQPPAPVVSEK